MPNHVTHRVIIIGPSERIDAFVNAHIRTAERGDDDDCNEAEGKSFFSLDSVIPMPQSIQDTFLPMPKLGEPMIGDLTVDLAATVLRHAKAFPNKRPDLSGCVNAGSFKEYAPLLTAATYAEAAAWLEREHPEWAKWGERQNRALKETSAPGWYEWSRREWGTKWEAYGFKIVTRSPERFEFVFETAWAVPEPVFLKLGLLWPKGRDGLTFDITSFDEGWNFAAASDCRSPTEYLKPAYPPTKAGLDMYKRVYGHDYKEDD